MQRSAAPCVEDDRIDIGLAAHGWRVGELRSHCFDRGRDAGFALALRATIGKRRPRKQRNRPKRCAPRAEILRREVRAHGVAQIFVHLVRHYGMTYAFVVDELEELLSGQLLAAPYETHQTSIVYRHFLR